MKSNPNIICPRLPDNHRAHTGICPMRDTSLSLWLALVLAALAWPSVVAAALKVWTGAGTDGNWTTAANWATNVPPVAGDILVFPGLVAKKFATNNFPANTLFGGLSLRDAYTLRG